VGLPLGQASPKIVLEAGCSLIPLFGRLREQLHRYCGDRSRQPGYSLRRWDWLPRDMAVHPFHGIGRRERKRAGEHLVERDAERVQVASRIDRTVHATRLLGRHVCERAGDELGQFGRLPLAQKTRGYAKAGESDPIGVGVDEHVDWFDVLVDQAASVEMTDGT
jgi:hypothetical protein